MPSGAKSNEQYQYKLSMAEQIEELKKKRELLGMFLSIEINVYSFPEFSF